MKRILILTQLLCIAACHWQPVLAQPVNLENTVEVVLSDGMNIQLFGGFDENKNSYVYLPPAQSLRLGRKEDGETPEFLFMKFTTEEKETEGGVQGAIIHFLMEWGLTPEQLAELEEKVKERTGGSGTVKGPIDMQAVPENSFQIISAVLTDKGFTPNFMTSGEAPPMPGGKAAVASRLDKNGAQLLAATFEKSRSITDVSLALNYEYTTLIEAANGTLTYNWDRVEHQSDALAKDYIKKELDNNPQQMQQAMDLYEKNKDKASNACGLSSGFSDLMIAAQAADKVVGNTGGSSSSGGTFEYYVGETEMHKIYEFLQETEVIELKWSESIADERLDVIRQAFFDYFLNAFADEEYPDYASSERLTASDSENPVKKDAEGAYSFKSCAQLTSDKHKSKTINLKSIRLPLKRKHQMVTNLASTYDQVRHNPKCVTSVNLNDPFFQHRDISFILDLEAQEMFQKEVNYVTINVRKKRSSGNDFQDAVTMSQQYLADKGTLASITYARGEDRNSDIYEYKTQWSLKGGNIYPSNPGWQKGDWQGVTLSPPVKPLNIEFEGDLNELKALDFTRATLQLRFYKYGQEVEHNIQLALSKEVPIMTDMIFIDRDTHGYAYRIIYNHKTEGKIITPWKSQVNDNYVYALVPQEWMDENDQLDLASEALKEAQRVGKEVISQTGDKVLEEFAELIK